jgi:hypothetical protein
MEKESEDCGLCFDGREEEKRIARMQIGTTKTLIICKKVRYYICTAIKRIEFAVKSKQRKD